MGHTTTFTFHLESAQGEPTGVTGGGQTQAETTAGTAVPEDPPNPILPTGQELIWGAASFLVIWALMKFVLLKPVVQGMQDRADKIRGDLAAADEAERQAESALEEYKAGLASAKAEATRLIEDARAQGEAKRAELIAAAEAEVAGIRASAADEVARAKEAALAELQGSVSTIAVQAAGAVIQKPLDEGSQRAIVDDYLSRSGSQN